MDLGRHLIARVLDEPGVLRKLIDKGFDMDWLTDKEDLSRAAIFGETDIEAYRFILRRYADSGEVPTLAYFRESYPVQSFKLPEPEMTVAELLAAAVKDRKSVQVFVDLSAAIDWHDKGQCDEAIETARRMVERCDRITGNRMALTPASAIKPKPVRWLWADRHPLRYLSLVVGKPDLGKSQFGIWESAQVTRGMLPGHFHGLPRGVIYVATEDSWDDTIVPRLIAAGADLDRVYRVDSAEQEGKGYTLSLVRDLDHLWQLITKYDIGLVVFDPLVEVVGGSSWNKAEEVREALRPLAEMLRDTDSAAVGLMHYRKQVSEDVLTQIAGSGAWGQVVRAVTAFARAPEDEDVPGAEKTVIVSQAKSNLGRGGLPNLTFTFRPVDVPTDEGTAHVSRIEWGADSAWSAEDILTGRHKAQNNAKAEVDRCAEWLAHYLGDGKPVLIEVVEAAGEDLGYGKRMIGRAKTTLNIVTKRVGGSNGPSTWRLVRDA